MGYSLYDTVVVFHRIVDNMKESRVRCTFMTMANHSINQVLIRTINTTLTSLIPVLAMLFFGGETLKDFAFAMAVGLIAGSYSSIAVATPLYAMWKSREPKYKKLIKRLAIRSVSSPTRRVSQSQRALRVPMVLRWLWIVSILRTILNQHRLRRSKLNLRLSRRASLSATRERKKNETSI